MRSDNPHEDIKEVYNSITNGLFFKQTINFELSIYDEKLNKIKIIYKFTKKSN